MAIPALPLAILDGCGTLASIARGVDGNATPPKSLYTLGVTAGKTVGGVYMSEFVGYTNAKAVSYTNFCRLGTCGLSNAVTVCSCLTNSPAMVSGDRYDANIAYCVCISSFSSGARACVAFYKNSLTTVLQQYVLTSNGVFTGTYTVQDVLYTDKITIKMYAYSPAGTTVSCACTNMTSLTDQIQSAFAVGSPSSDFAISVGPV